MNSSIRGVYAAAVTPRRLGTQDINLGAMWDLIDFLVAHGVEGIVLLGSTGEFIHFSNSERMRLMGLAVKRSRVPVIFNCSHSTFDGVVELAQAAEASGAAAVLVMPPYYFSYTQDHIAGFYRQVVEAAEIQTPVLLYNIPQFTTGLSIETISSLISEGAAVGVKDSSGDAQLFSQIQALRDQHDFALMVGNDALATSGRAGGCDGVISGVASAIPELLLALDRAGRTQAAEVVTRLDARLHQFLDYCDKLPTPMAVKEATAARGLKLGPHSLSCDAHLQRAVDEFREWFRGWLPQVLNECKHV